MGFPLTKYMWMIKIKGKTLFYIYVKTHNKTNLKYLGFTKSKDPHKYRGSGLYWKSHLKIHGNDVKTEIIHTCNDKEEVKIWGEYYSNLYNIVESKEWANLKLETGEGGSNKGINLGRKHSEETRKKISDNTIGKSKRGTPLTTERKEYLRQLHKGKPRSIDSIEKMMYTKNNNPFKHTEETKNKMKKPKSDEAKLNMKKSWKEKRDYKKMWITNGKENKLINILDEIPNEWQHGRTEPNLQPPSQKGKFWINNGSESKLSTTLINGWTLGRIYKRKEIKNA